MREITRFYGIIIQLFFGDHRRTSIGGGKAATNGNNTSVAAMQTGSCTLRRTR